METGTVKWFNSKKGYGFITKEDGDEIFVHYSNIQADENSFKTLYPEDEVEFDVEQGAKGPEARNVNVTKQAPRPQYNNNYNNNYNRNYY